MNAGKGPGGKSRYAAPEAAVRAVSSALRAKTQQTGNEVGAGIYKTLSGGYYVGRVYQGGPGSIALGFIATKLERVFRRQVGFIHTHPDRKLTIDSHFTVGDAWTAKLTGACYLVAPGGEYVIQGGDIPWNEVVGQTMTNVLDQKYARELNA